MRVPCAECLCAEADPVAYRWRELPLALALVSPFRCRHCYARFLRFSPAALLRRHRQRHR